MYAAGKNSFFCKSIIEHANAVFAAAQKNKNNIKYEFDAGSAVMRPPGGHTCE
jgi:hypothetical protein